MVGEQAPDNVIFDVFIGLYPPFEHSLNVLIPRVLRLGWILGYQIEELLVIDESRGQVIPVPNEILVGCPDQEEEVEIFLDDCIHDGLLLDLDVVIKDDDKGEFSFFHL